MAITKCPKCNQPIQGNSRFCGSCGQRIDNPAAETPAATQPSLVAAIPAAAMAGGAAAPGATAPGATAAGTAPPWVQGLIERVKNIVLSPRSEWPVIAPEPTSILQLYTGYVMPLAALAAVISFIHISAIGMHVPFAGIERMPIGYGLSLAIRSFAFGLVGLFLVGLIIDALAPTFAGSRDRRQALKVAAYSFTPAWLSSIVALSPILPTLLQWAVLFYGIYVLYLGLPVLMRSPQERALGYTATVVVCTLLLGLVFMVVSVGAGRMGWGPGARDSAAVGHAAAQTQGATAVGNIIGNALGTDEKGKAGLSAALANLAKAGEQSGSQASAPAAGAAGAQSPLSAAGGLVTALGGALGGSHRVDVVDFKTLTAILPSSLPNMKRTAAQGENQGAVGVKTSSAKATP